MRLERVLLWKVKACADSWPDSIYPIRRIRYLQRLFGDIGIHEALREAGVQDGDTVCVEGLEFEFVE